MWLAYLDESGNTGANLEDADQPMHTVVAVLVPEDRLANLEDNLRSLVAANAHHCDTPLIELHGSQLIHGSGPWRGVDQTVRLDVYGHALGELAVGECAVAWAEIDKPRLAAKGYPATHRPHLLAINFLVEKIDSWIGTQRDPVRQRALLIADRSKGTEGEATSMVTTMQTAGNPFGGQRVKHIVDMLHFVDSTQSPGVQLADLVASLRARCIRVGTESERPADQRLWHMYRELVLPCVRTFRQPWPPPTPVVGQSR